MSADVIMGTAMVALRRSVAAEVAQAKPALPPDEQ
jgi:hypothetical protein